MKKVKKVVYIGGGTGASIVLGGLKNAKNCELTGIYPITDNGGSTGRLLKENKDLLPMGDLRKMILALMPENKKWQDLLDLRFEKGKLAGHNLGNIIIANLQEKNNNIEKAIDELKKELKIKADIFPVALKRANLCIELENRQIIKSETLIDEVVGFDGKLRIKKAWTEPKIKANSKVLMAILDADLIVIGPGDLFTSIVACLCVPGVSKSLKISKAKKVYVCNLMTKFGQTNNFSVQQHVDIVSKYSGSKIDFVLYNNVRPNKRVLEEYRKRKESYVEFFSNSISNTYNVSRIQFIGADLIGKISKKKKGDVLKRSLIHHDPNKLAKILKKL